MRRATRPVAACHEQLIAPGALLARRACNHTVAHTRPRSPSATLLLGALCQELAAAGIQVGAASDNVRDWWHPYGTDYDGLAVYKGALTLGQLDTAPNEGSWAHIVSQAPAIAMAMPLSDRPDVTHAFQPGAFADVILFPEARSVSELLSRPQCDRIVLRRGKVQESTLPPFTELDDLVSRPTQRSTMAHHVQRGATQSTAAPDSTADSKAASNPGTKPAESLAGQMRSLLAFFSMPRPALR